MKGGPGNEHGTNKPPPTRRVQERSKGDTTCPTTSQNPSLWHPSWLNKAWTSRKYFESEWLAKDNPETNPITIKPETASHVTELFWVLLPYCSPPRCPFPIKSLAFSAHMSPGTIYFWVLDKSPVSGPGRGSPFLQHNHLSLCHPLLLPSIFPSIRVFSNESVLLIRWPKYWSFSLNINPSNEHSGLIPLG